MGISAAGASPKCPLERGAIQHDDAQVQVIQSTRPGPSIGRGDAIRGLVVGGTLFLGAILLGYLVFGTPFLHQFTPSPRPQGMEILTGIAAWSFALTAPAGFGLVGAVRLATVLDRATSRPRLTPAVKMAAHLSEDCVVAARVVLPDGRMIPEIVVGPFGVAIIESLPPEGACRNQGMAWEARTHDGRWVAIENPLERAARDADRVRRWFGDHDRDFVVKVHAALVTNDKAVARTAACAVIAEDQIPAWLNALPVQRSLTADRRERIVGYLRPGH